MTEPGSGSLEVRGLATSTLADRPRALVGTHDGVVHLVPTADLTTRSVRGIDPRLGLVEITGTGVRSQAAIPVDTWVEAILAGQRALAHELVGAAGTMLRLARDHAVERVQFDRPIAGFQAVRHRLADSLVAIEAADAAVLAADEEGGAVAAALAKAIAGRSARTVARHTQQVLAGIGFTTEHPLHQFVRRALVLDHLLGSSRSLTTRLGEELISDHRSVGVRLPL
jgi:hypothetical protein